jgi:hypothetical protein
LKRSSALASSDRDHGACGRRDRRSCARPRPWQCRDRDLSLLVRLINRHGDEAILLGLSPRTAWIDGQLPLSAAKEQSSVLENGTSQAGALGAAYSRPAPASVIVACERELAAHECEDECDAPSSVGLCVAISRSPR